MDARPGEIEQSTDDPNVDAGLRQAGGATLDMQQTVQPSAGGCSGQQRHVSVSVLQNTQPASHSHTALRWLNDLDAGRFTNKVLCAAQLLFCMRHGSYHLQCTMQRSTT